LTFSSAWLRPKCVSSKLPSTGINEMLATDLPKEQIARHAGLNIKTINNMY